MLSQLQNISKHYQQPGTPNPTLVLDNISLQIDNNERIAIVGPSGSGKSTLLNILGTLDKPTSGHVLLDGNRLTAIPDEKLAEVRNTLIGFVFQMHHLLPQLTLIENILLPFLPRHDKQARSDARERAIHLIEKLSLSTKMHQYPTQLSVGECQRTALLRAIITQPRLLLADEPTGSLDAVNAVQLAQLLSTLSLEYNMAMVVVTHSMELASQMDKIYQLREGKLTLLNTSAT